MKIFNKNLINKHFSKTIYSTLGPVLLVKNYILFIFTYIFIDNLTIKI